MFTEEEDQLEASTRYAHALYPQVSTIESSLCRDLIFISKHKTFGTLVSVTSSKMMNAELTV